MVAHGIECDYSNNIVMTPRRQRAKGCGKKLLVPALLVAASMEPLRRKWPTLVVTEVPESSTKGTGTGRVEDRAARR